MKKARVIEKWLRDKLLGDGLYSYQDNRVDIVLSNWTDCDAIITAKREKTVLKRFFQSIRETGYDYVACFEESITGIVDGGLRYLHDENNYYFAIEQIDDGKFYVYLNVNNAIHQH